MPGANDVLAERRLRAAQAQLARLDKAREQLMAQIEAESKALQKRHEQLTEEASARGPWPPTEPTPPFDAQFDQFDLLANERLKPITQARAQWAFPASDESLQSLPDVFRDGDKEAQRQPEPTPTNPSQEMYASGRYIATGHGNHSVDSDKEYEYKVSPYALPLKEGSIVQVPVRGGSGHMMYEVTSLHTEPKFHAYHKTLG